MFLPSRVPGLYFGAVKRLIGVLFLTTLAASGAFAAPPGAVVSNQASVQYLDAAGQPAIAASNAVEVTTAVLRSASAIDFTRVLESSTGTWQETVGPAQCFQTGAYVTLPDPQLIGGNVIDPFTTQQVAASSTFNSGEPLFIRLADADQNLDFQQIDVVDVLVSSPTGGDSETIRLAETGLDTGVFAGYVPTAGGVATTEDCVLQVASGSSVLVSYTDPVDPVDNASSNALIDPTQRVFESRTGTLVDGTTIEIVNAASGLPATVFGNDGVSQFPAAIVSGGTATDSSGTSYVFGPGEYRFPVVPDGDYRLIVTPPPEYSAPSVVDPNDLQNLPGAPFVLSPASFGVTFTKSGDVSIGFDIPVDPRAEALFLQKRSLTTLAAPGDFVRYELTLENASVSGPATNVRIVDVLPAGVRFIEGSVRNNGSDAPDPVIGADLRTLEFDIGDIDVAERVALHYVVEIVAGDANDRLVNRASAIAGAGLVSNEATAAITLTEDLFRSTATIIGRVVEGDCSQETFGEDQGVANIRVYLEDGRYAVSDAGGRFHFEGVEAGTHVAQLDTFTVPEYFDVIGCSDTPGYAGRADSQFVKASRGSLQRADFYLRRKAAPEGSIDLELRNSGTDSADQVGFNLTINGVGNVDITAIDVMVMLPEGFSYEPGSMKIDGEFNGDPRVMGQVLSLALPDRQGNWSSEVEFTATIESHVSGELMSRAVARFDSPIELGQTTPPAETIMIREPGIVENEGYVLDLKFDVLSAELSAADRLELELLIEDWQGVQDILISAVGHSDSDPISPNNQHLFSDNYELSRARAESAAAYIASALGLDARNMQVEGRGPDEPVADNATRAGRQANRRVEMVMSGIRPRKPSFLQVTKESSGTQAAETRGAVPGTEALNRRGDAAAEANAEAAAVQPDPLIETLEPGTGMLLPASGYNAAIPATKVAIQHAPGQTVAVWVNGTPVAGVNFDALEVNEAGDVAVSMWKGVELVAGENRIRAVVTDADGQNATTITRSVFFTGMPIRGELLADASTLVADGKTKPVIAVRLFDRQGNPARPGMVGGFRIASPYRSWWEVEDERSNGLIQLGRREPTYRVGPGGIALIELEPTTRTGEVTLTLNFENNLQQDIRTWIRPAQRDWILVGFAEGSAAYNTLSDNIDAALAAGLEDEYSDEGRVAFFAKGQIRGDFLLTLAYDSDRERDRSQFRTVVDPNAYYPLYADRSEQRFEAASQRKLYVKLERNVFYALFGDYDTGLSVTELARYERRFNGFKSEFRGENAGFSVFAAQTDQQFNRDEIRGDGTSGLYQLSNAPIVANSDVVRIEVRDRFDSGVVLSTTTLARFLDYNLDTLRGTIYFKQPVPSRDLDFNPIFIVAEYESISTDTEDVVAGGRASLKTGDDRVEFGVTHINDQTSGAEAQLTGVDLRWQINDQTLLKAEIADSEATISGADQQGTASKVELEHHGENLDVRAFVREVEDGFGLGYQNAADSGVRRLGIDARARIAERWYVEGEAGWQQVLETEDIRNLIRAKLRYERDMFSASVSALHAEDKFEDGDSRTSDLAEFGLSKKLFDGRLTLRASGSTSLNEDAESVDFPNRLVFGADYRLSNGVDLVSEYEQASGADIDAQMTRVGVRATPWARAQIDTSLTNESTEFGPRLFANIGLVQGFQLNERWTLDIGADHSNTIVESGARPLDPDRELTSGSFNEDFVAVYAGALYTADLWSANTRVEYRNSDSEERTGLLFGWYREPTSGHGLSAGLTTFQTENVSGDELLSADLKFGWAYRLADRKWAFLNRIDLILDTATLAGVEEKSWRLINNFNANRRFSAATSLSLQYAFKYVRSDFDGDGYTGYTDLIGVDFRRALSDRWDIGANTSIYHSYESSVIDYGAGIDVGFNVGTNIWLTLGYNIVGFHDEDFAQARYTAQGPFLRFSVKADQRTLKDIAGQR